jgi:Uma2 family endonuclease
VYKFPGAETGLLPDVGFIGIEKVSLIADRSKLLPFAPDLAVEVASPSQGPDDMAAKARAYLAGGTCLVWVIWPTSGHIDVWHPDHMAGPALTLNISETLDGEDVIPGFTYSVAGLFADPLG